MHPLTLTEADEPDDVTRIETSQVADPPMTAAGYVGIFPDFK
jgi:hypothetical protein